MADLRGWLTWKLFDGLFKPWMPGRIGEVLVTGLPADLPSDEPLILCPNHVSWWDGFLARDLHRRLRPRAPFRTLVLESEVRRHPFLERLGAVAIEPGSAGSLRRAGRSLRSLRAQDPGLVTTIFPQGRIGPSHRRPLAFRGGLAHFRRLLQPCWILPVALHLEFLNRPWAHAFIAAGPPLPPGAHEGDLVPEAERRVTAELDAIRHFVAQHGERAPLRWPGPGTSLPRPPVPPRTCRARPFPLHPWPSPN